MLAIIITSLLPSIAAVATLLALLGYVPIKKRAKVLRNFVISANLTYLVAALVLAAIYDQPAEGAQYTLALEATPAIGLAVLYGIASIYFQVRLDTRMRCSLQH